FEAQSERQRPAPKDRPRASSILAAAISRSRKETSCPLSMSYVSGYDHAQASSAHFQFRPKEAIKPMPAIAIAARYTQNAVAAGSRLKGHINAAKNGSRINAAASEMQPTTSR